MKKISFILAALLLTTKLFAEPNMSATIQNMHLWRGGEVADGFVLTTDFNFTDATQRYKFGFWGGSNSVGEYKEFNYYLGYTAKNLSLTLCDTYNFSTYATYNNEEFFNYNSSETGRFLDASIRYYFGDSFPLTALWATVLFGRDRDAGNSANRYSTFCSIEYPIYKNGDWRVDAGAGVAFALRDIDNSANFYGEKAGIVEATIKISNKIKINKYEVPVSMVAMWNPQSDRGYLQLCAQIITF
ncbi:MAG: hypothetical protein SNH73_05930 [Rikenellaceae bacterium]